MNIQYWQELQNNELLRKRLAKLIAHDCFRNTKLEYFHSPPLSRLSDSEMKELMIDVVNHTYGFISELFEPEGEKIIARLKDRDLVPEWNDPA